MPDVHDVLRRGPWFRDLPPIVQQAVLAAGQTVRLDTGALSFAQGAAPSGLHAVVSGQLRIAHVERGGRNVLMALVRPGEWTGFLCSLDGQPHYYSATAAEPSLIFRLHHAAVCRIFEADVATYKYLMAPELAVARGLARYAIADVGRPLAQRVAARLRDLGRWGYGPATGRIAPLAHVSQEDLAMSTHTSRQSVNAILRNFEAQGWIATGYGKVEVIDAAALEAYADSGP